MAATDLPRAPTASRWVLSFTFCFAQTVRTMSAVPLAKTWLRAFRNTIPASTADTGPHADRYSWLGHSTLSRSRTPLRQNVSLRDGAEPKKEALIRGDWNS